MPRYRACVQTSWSPSKYITLPKLTAYIDHKPCSGDIITMGFVYIFNAKAHINTNYTLFTRITEININYEIYILPANKFIYSSFCTQRLMNWVRVPANALFPQMLPAFHPVWTYWDIEGLSIAYHVYH